MKIPMVKRNFSDYSDPRLNLAGRTIIDQMTNNAHYPTPTPGLNEVNNAWGDYHNALTLAQNGDRTLIAAKNQKKQVLADTLFKLANYVNLTAAGNVAALLSSGMELNKVRTPVILTKPVISVANGQNPGDMIISIDSVFGATSFMYQYTVDPVTDASVWTSRGNNNRSFTFSNLESGKKFWFRVTAIGSNNQELVSEVVAAMVV